MSPRTGRPKSDNSKGTMLRVRVDKETERKLEIASSELNITKSEVVFELPINVNQRQSTSIDADNAEKSLPERVLTLIEANKRISIAELANSTNQSKSSIDRVIAELKRNGKLSRSGTARNGQWILL